MTNAALPAGSGAIDVQRGEYEWVLEKRDGAMPKWENLVALAGGMAVIPRP
ncbi:MAG: hypothetical protein RL748_16 [Pseudomonadota bacterium]